MIGSDTGVVSFQNGVRKDEVLRDVLGERAVIGGTCYIAATIAEPGVIRHTGVMQRLVFGEYDGAASVRTTNFLAACQGAGINAEISADIRRAIWEKFVLLVGLSGTTTATRLTIGPIRAHPQTRALLLDTMREVVAVGRAEGVPVERLAARFQETVAAVTRQLCGEVRVAEIVRWRREHQPGGAFRDGRGTLGGLARRRHMQSFR